MGTFIGLIILLVLLLFVVVPLAILWLVVTIGRSILGGLPGSRYDPAGEALRVRFARGEITQQQLEEGMRALGYQKVR
jgi:uncharacterized membrane protein